jgi:hypothetical protein
VAEEWLEWERRPRNQRKVWIKTTDVHASYAHKVEGTTFVSSEV